MGMNNLDVTLQ